MTTKKRKEVENIELKKPPQRIGDETLGLACLQKQHISGKQAADLLDLSLLLYKPEEAP